MARDAGLGELGRLGAFTTDLLLVANSPVRFGVQEFCARCRKFAESCPAGCWSRSR